jgi:hypothetical protein
LQIPKKYPKAWIPKTGVQVLALALAARAFGSKEVLVALLFFLRVGQTLGTSENNSSSLA